MSNPIIKIHDVETGEVIEREMNAEEFAQHKKDQAAAQTAALAEKEKAVAKASLLQKLGITEEEVKLLLG